MKKYIREMIDDLRSAKQKNFIPAVPKNATKEPVEDLMPPPEKPVADDLSNQILSKNHAERVKQLDYQAHQNEILQTEEGD